MNLGLFGYLFKLKIFSIVISYNSLKIYKYLNFVQGCHFDNLDKKKTWNLGNFAENLEKVENFDKNLNTWRKLEFLYV